MNQDDLNQQFIDAAKRGDTGEVQSLLDRGAYVHAADDWALCLAALKGHTEVVALLLEHEADVHALDDDALRSAANNGHTDVVALLLAQPTFTIPRLRAAMARYQADDWKETDAFRMIPARIDVLAAEDLAKRARSSGLSNLPTQPDGGLGL